jgi:hypothetical protein
MNKPTQVHEIKYIYQIDITDFNLFFMLHKNYVFFKNIKRSSYNIAERYTVTHHCTRYFTQEEAEFNPSSILQSPYSFSDDTRYC